MRRKPPGQDVVHAIQRIQLFSAALAERKVIQEIQEHILQNRITLPERYRFHRPQDQLILDYMEKFEERFPPRMTGEPIICGTLLLILWLAECRATPLGALLEGEVGLPYPTPEKQYVYKAKLPLCLYPDTCLACAKPFIRKRRQRQFCDHSCRSSWMTIREAFEQVRDLSVSKKSVIKEYGILFNAYCLFLQNPHYRGYNVRNPQLQEWRHGELADKVTEFQDEAGQPVDLTGNPLPQAHLISDIEELLPEVVQTVNA